MLLVQRRRPYTSFVVKKAGSMGQKSSRVLCLGARAVQRIQEPCQTRGPGSFPCLDIAAISDIFFFRSLIGSLGTVGCCCLIIGMFRLSYDCDSPFAETVMALFSSANKVSAHDHQHPSCAGSWDDRCTVMQDGT